MRPVVVVTGVMLVALGCVAVITAEFGIAGTWLLAGGLAIAGLAGLFSAVSARNPD